MADGQIIHGVHAVNHAAEEPKQEQEHVIILAHHAEEQAAQVHQQLQDLVILSLVALQ